MSQLRLEESALRELGVAVSVVTFDNDFMADSYVRQTGMEWPLLIDQDRKLYKAYGMERGSWGKIAGPLSIWRYLKLMFRGRRLQKPGSDYRQLGGDVLIDPQGRVRLHHISDNPHDRPTVEAILDVVRRCQIRGGQEDGNQEI